MLWFLSSLFIINFSCLYYKTLLSTPMKEMGFQAIILTRSGVNDSKDKKTELSPNCLGNCPQTIPWYRPCHNCNFDWFCTLNWQGRITTRKYIYPDRWFITRKTRVISIPVFPSQEDHLPDNKRSNLSTKVINKKYI